jgi:predicted  nucleic acid-binding Zn-ribbon protein
MNKKTLVNSNTKDDLATMIIEMQKSKTYDKKTSSYPEVITSLPQSLDEYRQNFNNILSKTALEIQDKISDISGLEEVVATLTSEIKEKTGISEGIDNLAIIIDATKDAEIQQKDRINEVKKTTDRKIEELEHVYKIKKRDFENEFDNNHDILTKTLEETKNEYELIKTKIKDFEEREKAFIDKEAQLESDFENRVDRKVAHEERLKEIQYKADQKVLDAKIKNLDATIERQASEISYLKEELNKANKRMSAIAETANSKVQPINVNTYDAKNK